MHIFATGIHLMTWGSSHINGIYPAASAWKHVLMSILHTKWYLYASWACLQYQPYIYIYIYVCVCVCVCVHTYTHIHILFFCHPHTSWIDVSGKRVNILWFMETKSIQRVLAANRLCRSDNAVFFLYEACIVLADGLISVIRESTTQKRKSRQGDCHCRHSGRWSLSWI